MSLIQNGRVLRLVAQAMPQSPALGAAHERPHPAGNGQPVGSGRGKLPAVARSYVVTGGGRGIGKAIAERLLADGDAVVVLERDEAALG